jgi:hypothetical protein
VAHGDYPLRPIRATHPHGDYPLRSIRATRPKNFEAGAFQVRNDTCGLHSVWIAIKDTTSLAKGQFSKVALKLRQAIRGKRGLHEEELVQFINDLDENLWAITKRAYSDLELSLSLKRGAVIAHVDGDHWVRVIQVFEEDGKQWIRVFDSGAGGPARPQGVITVCHCLLVGSENRNSTSYFSTHSTITYAPINTPIPLPIIPLPHLRVIHPPLSHSSPKP